MRLDPLNILLNKDFNPNQRFYFISGNEITLMEKVSAIIIKQYQKRENVSLSRIETINDFIDEVSLFENKKIYYGKNLKGIDEENLKKISNNHNVFIFIQENSQKTKKIKNIFLKDKNSYLIDCYELDKNSKIKILNEFLKTNKIKFSEDTYWMLIEKLDSKYIFLENTLNKILELEKGDLNSVNINKVVTTDETGKERLFFYQLKKNKEIIRAYRDKIVTSSDVNDLYYFCRFFCQLIIDSKNEEDCFKRIPLYLFKERSLLVSIFNKYNFKKKKLLLNLLSTTEKVLRKENNLSIVYGLRFLLNIKKITIS